MAKRRPPSSSSSSPRIVALVSTYRGGRGTRAAVRSAAPLDHVVVFEGPVEGNQHEGPELDLTGTVDELAYAEGSWATDAAKRTAMLQYARGRWPGPLWGLWLDDDEILLNGEQLHDWVWRVEQSGEPDNPVGGWPIALVELDGTTSICMGKCVRLDLIRRYLVSSSLIELENGEQRAVGNVDYWTPLQGPTQLGPDGRPHWRARPPLQGEPHLQHRPLLRDRYRAVERQHVAEARNYAEHELEQR